MKKNTSENPTVRSESAERVTDKLPPNTPHEPPAPHQATTSVPATTPENSDNSLQPVSFGSKFAKKGIPIEIIMYYMDLGLETRDVARLLDTTVSNINTRLRESGYHRKHDQVIKQNQEKMFRRLKALGINEADNFLAAGNLKIKSARDLLDLGKFIGIMQDKESQLSGGVTMDKGMTQHIKVITDSMVIVQGSVDGNIDGNRGKAQARESLDKPQDIVISGNDNQ